MTSVSNWSTTAALNVVSGGTVGSGGSNINEGCFPGTLNDAMRDIMAQLATFFTSGTYTGTSPITLTSTDAGAAAGPVLTFYRNSASPAAADIAGKVLFQGEDSVGNTEDYAEIYQVIDDPTSTSEDASLLFRTKIAGTMTTVATIGSQGLGLPFSLKADGRLTLTTAVPVTVSDVLTAGTIYYTPYVGNVISLYDGTKWVNRVFSEISLALTATSGKPYDVFVYDNAGVAALETLVWTNDTTRATALVRQDGIWCKTGALTRRYIGTFYASAANQCEDSLAKRYVWNMYNRVRRVCRNPLETADTWNYTLSTIRQANANTANQFDFVRGLDEDAVEAVLSALASNTSTTVIINAGIGLDSTTAFATDSFPATGRTAVASVYVPLIAFYSGTPGIGRHFLTWLEDSAPTGTTTWRGDDGTPSFTQSGMRGSVFA